MKPSCPNLLRLVVNSLEEYVGKKEREGYF